MNCFRPRYEIRVVRRMAAGHWGMIFHALAPLLDEAQTRAGKHVPCPVHGGKDGFRLFPDYAEKGSSVCNSCGCFRDGFATLAWVNHWSFRETLEAVAKLIGVPPIGADRYSRQRSTKARSDSDLDSDLDSDFYSESVLRTVAIGRSVQGRIMEIRTEKPLFLRILTEKKERDASKSEKEGRAITIRDPELLTIVSAGHLQAGDRVRLTLQLKQYVKRNTTGKVLQKNIWTAEKLISLQEEKMLEEKRKAESLRRTQCIQRLWDRSSALPGFTASVASTTSHQTVRNPVLQYLRYRGIEVGRSDPEDDVYCDLRYGEQVAYDAGRSFPAMVAAVRDFNGRLVTLHKTFLTQEGRKAPVDQPKKLSALPDGKTVSGCAIRFGQAASVLAVAEGIETALSVVSATGLPCWSCLNAHGLETVRLPECVSVVFIFEDKDRSGTGQKAARRLRDRLAEEGRIACIISVGREIPDGSKGIDWNDVLMQEGSSSFPMVRRRRNLSLVRLEPVFDSETVSA